MDAWCKTLNHYQNTLPVGWSARGCASHPVVMDWGAQEAKEFGRNLAQLRRDYGFTQEQLAHAAEIETNQLQLIEYGRSSARKGDMKPSNPHLRTLIGIATAFNLSPSALLAKLGI